MVLTLKDFRLHSSLRKTLVKFARASHCRIRVDSAFGEVIKGCATTSREGQDGTWIVPAMIDAYIDFHLAGFAHSVETWVNEELVGGLYFVAIGKAVFGESMFHRVSDSSKVALAALVSMCRHFSIDQIDCQQNTRHLTSLGAREIGRHAFTCAVSQRAAEPAPHWDFSSRYWREMGIPVGGESDMLPETGVERIPE